MTNNNEKYIEKIKKLLALAKSTNPNEAAIAMNQAIKLMVKHNISNKDVELSEIEEHVSKHAPSNAEKPPRYFSILVSIISSAFGVRAYFTRENNKRKVSFYGLRERPQLAAYTFDVLSVQLVKARKEFLSQQNGNCKKITKINRADAFCVGWVNGVYQLIEDFAMTDEELNLLAEYRKTKELSPAKVRDAKKCNGSDSSQFIGYLQGKTAQLNHGVSNSGYSPSLIGGK
ncbi:DUF2786 domain-containing protein [Gilliamella sp. B2776]|uniref:DUF2786 domain-containing protein n=1 Tax=unclassified Gilliamella TaxID=2685620 RepID=UPI00226A9FBE|nr:MULTISPECIES: DUF2786 domain-containing protein [unclassified Gilliamella]MCX8650034.1 DUF2786 domain-containing protein [Gilliamella sp. B2779]MCX8654967.1 DUF2786 domain-containing protein [Gilliamella sp. B2737]MCX8691807.1 DUF2786 domain-containing protein [Gilliamella sp. B2776]MCX8701662.1 DUF2786 domain-containing protein [Gilliamella sp. B2840]MCX8702952.1 DUF2786 domain-containing protein [Gilliamella sp. B2781]